MKVEIIPDTLDREVLTWYDSASPTEISNALYHGYKIVSNPDFNRCIDQSGVSQLECDNSMLIEELKTYKTRIDKIRLETEVECRSSIQEKMNLLDERIVELKEEKKSISDGLKLLLDEKDKRITDMKRITDTQDEKIKALNDKNSDLQVEVGKMNGILSNSYKKGSFAENKLEEVLKDSVSDVFKVENIGSKESHSGDIHLKMNDSDGMVLVESKFYSDGSKHMINGEIKKFHSDIDSCKAKMDIASAVFVSISCDIPNITKDFACRDEKGMRCYYLANMNDEKCKLLAMILKIEARLYTDRVMAEGNESMNKFLMRNFMEITNNYRKIEELSPGYEEIKKAVDTQSRKYSKKTKAILDEIRIVSDTFTKLSSIDSVSLLDVSGLLEIESPHSLNMEQWDAFKNSHVRLNVETSELSRLKEELLEKDRIISESRVLVAEVASKAGAEAAAKPKLSKADRRAKQEAQRAAGSKKKTSRKTPSKTAD